MGFEPKKKDFGAAIGEVIVGTDSSQLVLGGEKVWPLYAFDGALGNPPRIGVEIVDADVDLWDESIGSYYSDCADAAAMAVKAAAIPGAEFVCLSLVGADPAGKNRSVEECVAIAVAVAEACPLPLCITGCGNAEKDNTLYVPLAEALQGKNILFLSATEDNYKAVGTGVGLAWGQKLVAESAVDINLAKQLNLLLGQIGVTNDNFIMDIGSAAAGYGFEYVSSTMERIKSAALAQNDVSLQVPIITPVGRDAWSTKEAVANEADFPAWGPAAERGINMEIATAAASLASGSNAVILRHPQSVETMSTFISLLTEGGE